MIPVIPWYLTLIALATNTTIAVAVWSILSAAARRTGLPPVTQRRVRFGTALFLGAWLGAALLLAPAPASLLARDRFYLSPLIPLFVVVPPAIALLALWRSPALQRVLGTASLPALIGVQLYRVMGAVFLVLLALGQLPAHFALPAGWGDIAIGVGAPLVAIALACGIRSGRAGARCARPTGRGDGRLPDDRGTGLRGADVHPSSSARARPTAAGFGSHPGWWRGRRDEPNIELASPAPLILF